MDESQALRSFGAQVTGEADQDLVCRLIGQFSLCQVSSTRTGISFLTAIVRSDGGSILKSDSVAGMVPVIFVWFPCLDCSKGTCL